MQDKPSNTTIYFAQKDNLIRSLNQPRMLRSFYNEELDPDSFADRLKHAMKIKKITQAKLAELADVTPITVYRLLHGKNTPREKTVALFADKLGVRAEWLLMKDPFMTEEEKKEAEESFDQMEQTAYEDNERIKDEALRIFADEAGFTILPAAKGGIYIFVPQPPDGSQLKPLLLPAEQYKMLSENLYKAFSVMVESSLRNYIMLQPDPNKIDRRY